MRSVSGGSLDPKRYDDMLDFPRHISQNHRPLSKEQRAAQFLPFAALDGYGSSISEAARKTEEKRELSDSQKEEINACFVYASEHPETVLEVTWFEKDLRKSGGHYVTHTGMMKRIDAEKIIFQDRMVIGLEQIVSCTIKEG